MVGEEFSFDSVFIAGEMVWHSISHYMPSPLTVLEHPWIQWCVVLPRDIGGPEFDPIRHAGVDARSAPSACTRGSATWSGSARRDGSAAVSEVGARPPGAQFSTLMSFAYDVDMYEAWARLDGVRRRSSPRNANGRSAPPTSARRVTAASAPCRASTASILHCATWWSWPGCRKPGQPTSVSYEGDGYVIVRHPETAVVEHALERLITRTLQIELE